MLLAGFFNKNICYFLDKKPLFKTDTSRHISQSLYPSNSSNSDTKPSNVSSESLKLPASSLLSSASAAASITDHNTNRTVKSEPSLSTMSSSLYSSYYHRLALHGTSSNEASNQDINSSHSGSVSSTFPSSELPALTPAPFSMSSSNATPSHGGGNIGSLLHSGVSHADSFNQTSSLHTAGSSSATSLHGQNTNHGNMQGGFTSEDFKYPNHVASVAAASASQSHHSHYPHSSAAMAAAASAHHGYLTNPANGSGVFPYSGLTDHSHHHYAKLNLQAS